MPVEYPHDCHRCASLKSLAAEDRLARLLGHVYIVHVSAQARDKQIARLTREERLGSLKLSLANNKRIRVAQLRSFSRVVTS